MSNKKELGYKIVLSEEKAMEIFHNALCNGLQEFNYYGIVLDYDENHYRESEKILKSNYHVLISTVCFEEVLIKMLELGYKLRFKDLGNEGKEVAILDKKKLLKNMAIVDTMYIMDTINEHDDAITADCILQTCIFGEIVYG